MILLPRQYFSQPQTSAPIDWSNRQAAGLVLYWPFDARGLRDVSNSFLNGTGSATSTVTQYGIGRRFDGSVDVRATPNSAITNATEWSCSAFVNFTSFANAYNTVLSTGSSSPAVFRDLHVKSNGKLAIYVSVDPNTFISYDGTGVYTLSANTWYHVAFTYSSATGLTGYVNGAVDATAAGSGNSLSSISGTSQTIVVGSNPPSNPTRYVNGSIFDARFYNRALRAKDILDIYQNPWRIFNKQPIKLIVSAGTSQNLSPPLFTNTNTFYSSTVSPGSANLSPGLFTNDQTFYSPTVTQTGVAIYEFQSISRGVGRGIARGIA